MPDPDKLDLDQMLTEAAGGTPTPANDEPNNPPSDPAADPAGENPPPADPPTDPVDPPADPAPDGDPTPPAGDPPADDPQDPPADPDPDDKPNPMKQVRDQLNAEKKEKELISNTMNKFASGKYTDVQLADHMKEDGSGIDYQSLSDAMDAVDNVNKAAENNITPEMQATIDRIEEEKREIEKEKLQIKMDKSLTNMQMELGIKADDVNNFFKDAMAANKNPYQWLAQGGSLEDLYNNIYAERIMQSRIDKAVADAKAQWDKENAAQPPISNPGNPAPPKAPSGDGMSLKDMKAAAFKKVNS